MATTKHDQQCESGCCRYADNGVRGGVLEAEGMVEIKFRTPDLLATMHRIDPVIAKLKASLRRMKHVFRSHLA